MPVSESPAAAASPRTNPPPPGPEVAPAANPVGETPVGETPVGETPDGQSPDGVPPAAAEAPPPEPEVPRESERARAVAGLFRNALLVTLGVTSPAAGHAVRSSLAEVLRSADRRALARANAPRRGRADPGGRADRGGRPDGGVDLTHARRLLAASPELFDFVAPLVDPTLLRALVARPFDDEPPGADGAGRPAP
jgi:hypothetical protein